MKPTFFIGGFELSASSIGKKSPSFPKAGQQSTLNQQGSQGGY
jgi:hypothetical protein